MITYEPFWDYLDWNEISTYTLINKHNISSSTINRLRHNKPISTETIDKLCKALDCDVDDIIKYTDSEQECLLIRINVVPIFQTSLGFSFCRRTRFYTVSDFFLQTP